jgi:hypothetical protein
MKKNLMMGLMVTLFTIISCKNDEEIRPTEASELTIGRPSGITFTKEELTVWRDSSC